jgi:hypothetical protein
MTLSALVTNPTARVYTLRFLLLANIPLMVQGGMDLGYYDPTSPNANAYHILAFSCSIVICVHHFLADCSRRGRIFKWTMRGLALIDVGAVIIEIGGEGHC